MSDKFNTFLYIAAAAANLMSFAIGMGYGWSSPALPKLHDLDLTPLQRTTTLLEDAWITSLLSLGAALGPFFSGFCSYKFGRKKTLLLFSIPILISHMMLIFVKTIEELYVSRFLIGLGTGCVFTVIPVYLAEISENHNRGLLSCFLGLLITSGNLFFFIIGPYVSIQTLGIIGTVPAVMFLVIFGLFIPESPHYYISKGDVCSAQQSLKKFRSNSDGEIEKELCEISHTVNKSQNVGGGFMQLFQSKIVLKGLLISNGLFIFQQLSGVVGIMAYLQIIFDSTGSRLSPEVSSMLVGFVQVVSTIITSQLIDKLGRRILLIISTSGVMVSLTSFGTYFYLQTNHYNVDQIFWLPVFSLMVYVICFNFGMGPIPWTILGEIFPSHIKSLATTVTATICLSLAFLVAMFFPSFTQLVGMANSFWVFAFCSAICLVFTILIIPETKGKSLQTIQDLLSQTK